MAIQKKSLTGKKAVSTKRTTKASPAAAKLQTAIKLHATKLHFAKDASKFVTASRWR